MFKEDEKSAIDQLILFKKEHPLTSVQIMECIEVCVVTCNDLESLKKSLDLISDRDDKKLDTALRYRDQDRDYLIHFLAGRIIREEIPERKLIFIEPELFEYLIFLTPDLIFEKNKNGNTLLQELFCQKNITQLRRILKKLNITDINEIKEKLAIKNSSDEITKSDNLDKIIYLLDDLKADPNVLNSKGQLPLIEAVECEGDPLSRSIITTFQQYGAKIYRKDASGKTPFRAAIERKKKYVFWVPDFPIVSENTLPYSQFLQKLKKNPTFLRHPEGREVNILEVPFLLNEPSLALVLKQFFPSEFDQCLTDLKIKYPDGDFTEFDECQYSVNFSLNHQVKSLDLTEEELNYSLGSLEIFFNSYFPNDPKFKSFLKTFKDRLPNAIVPGVPGISKEQAPIFYAQMESMLKVIGAHLAVHPDEALPFLTTLLDQLSLCPEAWMSAIRFKWASILSLTASSIQEAILWKLNTLKLDSLYGLALQIDQQQPLHALHFLLKTIGEKIQLPSNQIPTYVDPHALHYKSTTIELLQYFKLHFTPQICIEGALDVLNQQGEVQKSLGMWLRENIASSYKPDIYQGRPEEQKSAYIDSVFADEDYLVLSRKGALDVLLKLNILKI